MEDQNKNVSGYPQENDAATQSGWNTNLQSAASDPQDGWNTNPQSAASDPQSGWNTNPLNVENDAQEGWNTNPQKEENDSQSGWNTNPQSQDNRQEGWNTALPRTPYQADVRAGIPGENQQGAYYTYQEWQQQNRKTNEKETKHTNWTRILCIAGGLVAACAIFVGGAIAGGGGLFSNQDAAQDTASVAGQNTNTPKLTISETNTSSSVESGVLTGDQIYEKVSPSVVSIESTSLTAQGKSSGSGVLMTKDGYVVTNAHVIAGADMVNAITSDGMQYSAQVIGSDAKTDLAVLKISTKGKTFTPAEFGDSAKIKAGEPAYAIGSPGGVELKNTITTGSISAINRDITINDRIMTLIQTDASINPGNSGGALIDKYGQVVGITNAKLGISYYEGLGFAIPIDSAKDVVDQLIAYGYVPGRPAIGVTGYDISEETAQYNNVPQGVLITQVDANSDAVKKGLQSKDIITSVNGKPVKTMEEINKAKEQLKSGDTLKLTIYRISSGKTMDFTIKLVDENTLTSSSKTITESEGSGNGSGNGSEYGNNETLPWGY